MRKILSLVLAVVMTTCLFLNMGISAGAVRVEDIYLGNEIYVSPYEQIYIDWSSVYLAFPQFASYMNRVQYITVVSDHGIVARHTVTGTSGYIPGLPEDDSAYIAFFGIGSETADALAAFKIYVKAQTVQYPSATVNTANEYYLNFKEGEDVYVSFWNSYDDESNNAKWWRDNYYHYIALRKVTDFNDYNGYIYKNGNRYEWGDTYYYADETGWDHIGNASNIYPGQTDFILGKLPAGKYVVIVSSDMGWQNGEIIAKFNIDVEGKTTQVAQPQSEIVVKVNGKRADLWISPRIINGKLMVPIYEIYAAMGCVKFSWDKNSQALTAWYYTDVGEYDNFSFWVQLKVGNKTLHCAQPSACSETWKELEVAPVVIDGCVFATTDAITKAFPHDVTWNEYTNTLTINKKNFNY